jgi:hypothetical protein
MNTDEHGFTAAKAAFDSGWLKSLFSGRFQPDEQGRTGFLSVFISVNPWFEMNRYG